MQLSHYSDYATGSTTGVQFQTGANDGTFSLPLRVQADTRSHPSSYPIGTGASFSGGKAAVP
jgi:hypothetical protein